MWFRVIITVYRENRIKYTGTLCARLTSQQSLRVLKAFNATGLIPIPTELKYVVFYNNLWGSLHQEISQNKQWSNTVIYRHHNCNYWLTKMFEMYCVRKLIVHPCTPPP
jgi:hypothetical protein